MFKYEIWLYGTLVATAKTYSVAETIAEALHRKHPTTDIDICVIDEKGEILMSANM